LKAELKASVRKEVGPFAMPDHIIFTSALPKTRSGKIMRRILRKIAENDTSSLGDTSTLLDPGVFLPKVAIQSLVFLSTFFSAMFWFHVAMALYWVIFFKMQNAPHMLLPSALAGDEYEAHDLCLVILTCADFICVILSVLKGLKVFIFFVDWEGTGEGKRSSDRQQIDQTGMQYGQGNVGYGQVQQGQYGQRPGAQQYGQPSSGLLSSMAGPPQQQYGQYGQQHPLPAC